MVTLVLFWITLLSPLALIGVKGQTLLTLADLPSLPIGQGDQFAKSWIVTNDFGSDEVSQALKYHGKEDPNTWGGNMPWRYPVDFSSLDEFEYYLATNGMHYINIFDSFTDIGSDIYMSVNFWLNLNGVTYLPMAIDVDLGPLGSITTNSFYDLPAISEYIIIPIADLNSVELRCGIAGTHKFWYKYDSGKSTLAFGTTGDYAVTADGKALVFKKAFANATDRMRVTISAGGVTETYTQNGTQICPAKIIYSRETVRILTAVGSDITISMSVDGVNYTPVTTIPWNLNNGEWEAPIDHTLPMCLYRVRSE